MARRKKEPTPKTPVLPAAPVPPPPLAAGELVGDYEILGVLGEGGFGRVYLSKDVGMKRRAVVKLLHPWVAQHPGMVERFFNEARTAGQLAHPNIVTVYACGRRHDGQPFIAYQYLDGGPLSRLIQTTAGPMDLRTIVLITAQAAAGLHKAHGRGIVHRDVKPENIFLTHNEETGNLHHAHVIDFGIAKLDDNTGGVNTQTNMILGSPGYSSPEQLTATKDVDPRADVYSLACVVWEMATGERLWPEGLNPTAIVEQQLRQTRPIDPCVVRPDIPRAFGAAIARGLQYDRDDRWPDLPSMIIALAKAAPASDYGAVSGQTDAMDLVFEFAPELARATPNANTAGRPMPELAPPRAPANAATQRLVGLVPAVQVTPPPPMLGRSPDIPTMQHAPGSTSAARDATPTVRAVPASAPVTMTPAPIAPTTPAPTFHAPPPMLTIAAPTPTTLGGAVGQSVSTPSTPGAPRSRTPLVAAAAVAGAVAIALVVLIANRGRGDTQATSPASTAATSLPPMSAIAIVTEPSGASIYVDGSPRGLAPANIAAPAGAELELRAELAGHAPAVQRVRVGAEPATVRLVLTPIAIDAAPSAAPPDAGVAAPTARKRRTTSGRNEAGSGFNLDDVVGQ